MTDKQKFEALLASIEREDLRVAVDDSARGNANDTMIESGYKPADSYYSPWGDHEDEFWEMALGTAEMILDCPKDYYPELFSSAA